MAERAARAGSWLKKPDLTPEESMRLRRRDEIAAAIEKCASRFDAIRALMERAKGSTLAADISLLLDRLLPDVDSACAVLYGQEPLAGAGGAGASVNPAAASLAAKLRLLACAWQSQQTRRERQCLEINACCTELLHILNADFRKKKRAELHTAYDSYRKRSIALTALAGIVLVVALLAGAGYMRYSADMTQVRASLGDLGKVAAALQAYKAKNGHYPISSKSGKGLDGLLTCYGESGQNWIQDLAPEFIPALPRSPEKSDRCDSQYMYMSDGADYKLIWHNPPRTVVLAVKLKSPQMLDPLRPGHAFGYWTEKAASW